MAALCCVAPFAPFRACFEACFYSKPPFMNEEYDKVCLTFSTDYDKENPLTIKSGQLRLLKHQIKKAEEEGDDATVEQLKL